MYKKLNSKTLLIILAILVALVVVVTIYDSKKGERSFRAEMIDADTAKITKVVIDPKAEKSDVIELTKQSDGWHVSSGKSTYRADEMMINNILTTFREMKPLRMIANDKSRWGDYDVTDSSATKIKIFTGKKLASNLYVGRFNYQQPKNSNPQQYSYNQQRGTMTTYVRLADEKAVYIVEGFLGMSFNRNLNDYRDKTVIRSNKEDWTRLTFTYPADSSFTLSKENGKWMVNGLLADSASVAGYLNTISHLTSQNFADDTKPLSTEAVYSLSIDGNNFPKPLHIEALPADSVNKFLISSSLNEGIMFSGEKSGLTGKVFVSKSKFIK